MRERLTEYAPYISMFGLFLLVASPVVNHLAEGEGQNVPPQLAPVLAIVGVVLLLAWPLLRAEDLRDFASARQTRYGGNALILIVSVIGILVVVNFLSTRRYRTWDLTENKQYSVSRQTLQILDQLDEPVSLTAVVSQGEDPTTLQDLEELVDKYRQRSDLVSLDTIVRERDYPQFVALNERIDGKAPHTGIVAESGAKHAVVYSFDEQAVTESIVKATREVERNVYFTTGHGEADPQVQDQEGRSYSAVRQALEREGYTVGTMTITATLPAADLIVVAGPTRSFLAEEAEKLADYIEEGGSVMLLVDPTVEHGLQPVLKPFDIRLKDDLVIDPGSLLGPTAVPVVGDTGYRFHTITKDLSDVASIFLNARSLEIGTPVTTSLTTTALVESSEQAWGETDLESLQEEGGRPSASPEEQGPVALGVAAEGDEDYGRLVVYGTSLLASDGYLQRYAGISANGDLFLNSVNWLTQEEDLISIRPTEPDDRPLSPPSNSLLLLVLTAVVAPLAVLGVGGWVMWNRR